MSAIARLMELGDRAPWRLIRLSEKREIVCLVDAADYDWLIAWRWNYGWWANTPHKHYAQRNVGKERSTVYLHREIQCRAEPQSDVFTWTHHVDHINGQSLDDRRGNLRWATPKANTANRYGTARAIPSLESIVAGLLAEWNARPVTAREVLGIENIPGW